MVPQTQDGILEDRLSKPTKALTHGLALGISCLVTSGVTLAIYSHVHFVSEANVLLGVMWATVATVFVQHIDYTSTLNSVVSRMVATSISGSMPGLLIAVSLPRMGAGSCDRSRRYRYNLARQAK